MNNYDYPMGADNEYAPWNEREPEYEVCEECKGSGKLYYNDDGDCLTQQIYDLLPERYKEDYIEEECETCGGLGEIEVEEYDPENDAYDEWRDRHIE